MREKEKKKEKIKGVVFQQIAGDVEHEIRATPH
jgi:hypothetical protein